MQPDDFTFSMLAKAIAMAGGSIHITAAELLGLNARKQITMKDDGAGGQILTLIDKPRKSESER